MLFPDFRATSILVRCTFNMMYHKTARQATAWRNVVTKNDNRGFGGAAHRNYNGIVGGWVCK